MSVKDREGSLWYLELPAAGLRKVEESLCFYTGIENLVRWLTKELNDAPQLEINTVFHQSMQEEAKYFEESPELVN